MVHRPGTVPAGLPRRGVLKVCAIAVFVGRAVRAAATMLAMDAIAAPLSPGAALPEVSFRVGHAVLPPGPMQREQVLTAVEAANRRDRLPGLPPELDIGHRDPAKVRAFLDGWPLLPAALRARLHGAVVLLDAMPLRLGSSSALVAEDLARGYGLRELAPPQPGQTASLAIEARSDDALAVRRIAQAREALVRTEQHIAQAEAEVARERSAQTLRALAERREEAASLAMVWRDLLADLPTANPADRALAQAAVSRHLKGPPSRGGMP